MIFVTVGTHEQSFNRLIKEVDKLSKDNGIKDDFFIQIGFSNYIPQNCRWARFLSYSQMTKLMNESKVIITHGGPASFIEPLELGKVPIVVPRKKEFDEHINNHQVDFVKLIDSRMNNIIPIYNVKNLKNAVLNYKELIKTKQVKELSNNNKFNNALNKIVKNLMQK